MDRQVGTDGVLERQTGLHPQTDRLTERSHPSPVEDGQADGVDDVRRDVVQHQGGGAGLQGEVGHQGVVDEDLHLVAGHVLVELGQGGPDPADHGAGGVGQLEPDLGGWQGGNCTDRERLERCGGFVCKCHLTVFLGLKYSQTCRAAESLARVGNDKD